ncbi:MAG: PEP-CTERM sorting domain-containing protein [Alphaproteobacteria bacterium]|nr:PEP-CTERM sorting domain-containing protein [Alphaproteobacteria bacterium]
MTFDPALGLDASGPAGTVRYLGGAANNIPQLPLYTNVSMTINNVTRSMSGWHAALVYSVAGERYLHVNNDPTDANSFKRFAVVIQNPNLAANPANTSNGLTVAGFGAFDWLQGADTPGAAGSWNGGTLSISTAAVPEPASWALLIAGFGLTGATLRRRRALAA